MTPAERLYRLLLRLYPREFRDEYEHEMSLLFRERRTDDGAALWLQVVGDVTLHAPKEHWHIMKQDLRYAFRTWRRTPALAATIITILALGIGANSAIFTAVDAILLRHAPVLEPEQLVEVYTASGNSLYSSSSYPDYFDLRDSGTFAALAAYTPVSMTTDVTGWAEPIAGQLVSGNYFAVLGTRFTFGRGFAADEDRPGAPVHVAVISDTLWRRAFDRDRSAVGATLRLNGHLYTVVGIAPPGFVGPLVGTVTDVWVPTALQPELDPASASLRRARGHAGKFDLRRSRGLSLVGRLPPGMGIEQAVARADVLTNRLQAAYPDTNRNARFVLTPLGEGRGLRRASRPLLLLLTGVVALVLVVACVNIASLLLARAVSREPEVAIRLAMGASRARLVRQWLTESIVLGITGAIGALVVARVLTPLLHAFVIPEAVDLSLNGRVLAFTLVAGAGSGLVFGLAPVWRTLRPDLSAALRDRGTVSATPASVRMRNAFVVLQIAISLTLLVGAGLFLRTLANAYSVKLGYETTQTLVASLNLTPQGYFEGGARGAEAGSTVYQQILSRIEAIPGVAAAAAARMTVLSGAARSTAVSLDGRPLETDGNNAIGVRANVVSRRYFETLQIPILRGRAFSESDRPTTPRVTIVTQSLADRLWPHDDPVGKSLRDEDHLLQVVGIVPDTVYTSTVERERPPTYYLPLAQNYESAVTVHVRAHGDPMSLVPRIRDAVRQVDGQIALEQPQRLGDVLDRTLGVQRMMATFVGLFGALALALAVLGLYGVMAHAASRRMPEIGVRLALGARPQSIAGLLIGDGLRLLGIGAALGLAAAFLVARSIESQLFGIAATDPLTFLIGCTVLAITSVVAATIPALRAMRVDPVTVLRQA